MTEEHRHTFRFEGDEEIYLDKFLVELGEDDSSLRSELRTAKGGQIDAILGRYGLFLDPPFAVELENASLPLPDPENVRDFRERMKAPDLITPQEALFKTHPFLVWRVISAGGHSAFSTEGSAPRKS